MVGDATAAMKYSLARFLTILLMMVGRLGAKRKLINIFWNTTSPMFRIDNTDNIIDINRGNLPWEYDQANIICPVYPRDASDDEIERYIIYSVSREEYESCRIVNPSPKIVAVCDKPHQLLYVTITFRSFTPTPGGLEFEPGHDYYFISTSSRRDLHRKIGGRCSTHNMRATFKVAAASHGGRPWQQHRHRLQQQQQQNFSTTVNVPRSFDSNSRRSDVQLQEERSPNPIYHEVENSNSLEDQEERDARRRRMQQQDDFVKQEASVMHPGSPSSSSASTTMTPCSPIVISSMLVVVIVRTLLLSRRRW